MTFTEILLRELVERKACTREEPTYEGKVLWPTNSLVSNESIGTMMIGSAGLSAFYGAGP
jgi:hypothetical protein